MLNVVFPRAVVPVDAFVPLRLPLHYRPMGFPFRCILPPSSMHPASQFSVSCLPVCLDKPISLTSKNLSNNFMKTQFVSSMSRVAAPLRFVFRRCKALIKLLLTCRVEMMERSGRDGVNGERSGMGARGKGEGVRRECGRNAEGCRKGVGEGWNRIGRGLEWGREGGNGGG